MTSHNASPDEGSRPLLSEPNLQKGTSPGQLHPAMIARPLSPPAQGYRDEDGHRRTWPMNQVLVWFIRPAAVILAFIDVMVQLTANHGGISGIDVMLIIITFMLLFWNLFKLIPKKAMGVLLSASKDGSGDDMEVSCNVGRWKVFCFGGDVDEELGVHHGDAQPGARRPSLLRRIVSQGLVDLVLASFLMLFDILVAKEGRRAWYDTAVAVTVLTSIIVGLQYIMIFLPHISSCGPFSITLNYKHDDPYHYRIRLPQDEAAAQASARGKQPVSVTA
ncbi:hypothetical protein PG993_004611 [Apiospora rasikravindrae]|uniref:Uncharacterized protein n=1 Tax=Apiospora rasikravindrae TaxID=990691 RepID=A0ABR1TDW8_9PEZI